ncbi:TonB-dependent receptor [Roseovarius sp. SCSIO 43702]|uniref:TonB-dependent receptor plug domain-containing protein n=1 Tax=Roseovarius sp. SCSIO 43702 TaxID=2823043 RepID=UPI001C735540|nr:TonB-dependent receptor [Roseovarius sp. SCSIO 43702]QYX55708.1 TonB-dependent receptor [Roseovarius sp. SCSIO 43702]
MTRFTIAALMGTSALTLVQAATAQEAFDLDTIIVSGSLTPVEAGRSGASVEVIEDENLSRRDTTVIQRLTRLPGVSATSNGGLGALSTVQVRGLPARYVSVRYNGIDVADPSGTQNQFNFGGLTPLSVDRIEVLKGSQSALYGSEAIAGLIDVTSYRPEKLGFSGEVLTEAGSNETYQGALNLGHKTERGQLAFTYAHTESDGISNRSSDTEKDGFDQDMVVLYGDYAVSDSLKLGATAFYRNGDTEYDLSRTDSAGLISSEEIGARVFAEFETGPVTHTLSYAHYEIDRDDPQSPFTIAFDGERKTLAYLLSAELGARTTLNGGVEYTEESYATAPGTSPFASPAARGSEDNTAVNVELLHQVTPDFDISAALRHDDNSSFGGKTTGRIAAIWRPADDLAIRALIGTGYRAPSLYERFGQYGVATLRPEESRSFELGVEKTFGDLGFVEATLFYTEIDDLIDFDGASTACGNPFPGCYNQIPGTTTAKGIELAGEYGLTDTATVYGNYTYTDAETNGARLTRTPKHDLVLGLRNDFTTRFSAEIDLRRVADVEPSPFAPAGHKVGDYTLVGVGMTYEVTDRAQAYLRVENLFNEDYETAGGFNQPGRTAFVGLRASF